MASPKRWTIEIQESADGGGDDILQLPDEIWNELTVQGWQVGEVLEIELGAELSSAMIRNPDAECRRISAPSGKS